MTYKDFDRIYEEWLEQARNREEHDPGDPWLEDSLQKAPISFRSEHCEPRPKRDGVISKDDVTNLKILLNSNISMNEFLRQV